MSALVNPCGNLESMHAIKNEIGRIYAQRPLTAHAQQTIGTLYSEWDAMRRAWLTCSLQKPAFARDTPRNPGHAGR